MEKKDISVLMLYYPELWRSEIKTSWKTKDKYDLMNIGYKYCPRCRILVKTVKSHCSVCGKKMRTRILNQNRNKDKYSYAVDD